MRPTHLLLGVGIAVTALLTGCSSVPVATPTPYKSANSEQSYGYSSEKLGNGEYRILFKASDRTPGDKVQQDALRRAAEIAKQNNFGYVAVTKTNITKKRVLAREVIMSDNEPVVFPSDKQCTMSGCSDVAQPSTVPNPSDIEKTAMKELLLALLATTMMVAGMFGTHVDRAGLGSLMILLLLAFGIFALHLKKINRLGFFSLLLLLMVMDLMGKNSMLIPLIDREFYTDPPPLAKRLGGTADSFGVNSGMLLEKPARKKVSSNPAAGKTSRPPYNLLSVQLATRDQVYPNIGAVYGLGYVDGYATMKTKKSQLWHQSFVLADIPKKKRILKRSNVKYWVTEDYEQLPSPQYPRGVKKVNVFEDALPRAFLVGESRVVPSAEQLDTYYASAFDPLRQVLLAEKVVVKKEKNFSGQVERIEYGPNRVTLKTKQNGEGFLVLLDTWFPGWKVEVDGQLERIYRANYFYRAVKLGPGYHRIEFSYEPIGLRMGFTISGMTFILLLLAVGATWRNMYEQTKD